MVARQTNNHSAEGEAGFREKLKEPKFCERVYPGFGQYPKEKDERMNRCVLIVLLDSLLKCSARYYQDNSQNFFFSKVALIEYAHGPSSFQKSSGHLLSQKSDLPKVKFLAHHDECI